MSHIFSKAEICSSCVLTLTALSAVLHGIYFALALVSVATGAFLGIIGVINWWRSR